MKRLIFFLVYYIILGRDAFPNDAIVKSSDNAEIYYTESHVIDKNVLSITECGKNETTKLERNKFVILESKDLCLNISFAHQKKFVEGYLLSIKDKGFFYAVNISFPSYLTTEERKDLMKIKQATGSFNVVEGTGKFSVKAIAKGVDEKNKAKVQSQVFMKDSGYRTNNLIHIESKAND